MEFCPACGSRLVPKRTETAVSMACSKCNFVKKPASSKESDVKTGTKVFKHNLYHQMTIISKKDQVNTMPTMRMECPKCRNMLVFVWQVQTRGGDEASTQFFRCTKCNHTFREYS
jgi:transcription factor S